MWLWALNDPFRCMPHTLLSLCSSIRRLVAWLYHACVLAQSSCLASWISGQCDSQDLTAFGHFGSERITKLECSDAPDIASICRLNSVRHFQLHSLSAFVSICVCVSYFGWHTLSWGHLWSLWLRCALWVSYFVQFGNLPDDENGNLQSDLRKPYPDWSVLLLGWFASQLV